MPVFNGTDGADSLVGTNGDDTFFGGAGNDRIITRDGNDVVEGGDGDDELNYFDTGTSTGVYRSTGSKTISGGSGDDHIAGGSGGDTLNGDDGDDDVLGYEGNDTLRGGAGNDYLRGMDGDDSIDGGGGNDSIVGESGADVLHGGDGNDTVRGGDGDDTVRGGAGSDRLYGDGGSDTFYIDDLSDMIMDPTAADRAIVAVNFAKVSGLITSVTYVDGAQALPYWIDALVGNNYGPVLLGASRTYSYVFPTALPSYETNAERALGWQPFSAEDRAAVASLFSYISSLVDLQFVAGTDAAALNVFAFQRNTQSGSAGYAYLPSTSPLGNDVYIATSTSSLASGSMGAGTLSHEVGHALGLKHPHGAPPNATEGPYLPASEDVRTITMLSYTGMSDTSVWRHRYGDLDIAALQYLYGPSRTARTGNDTYTLSATTSNFIWDGGGTDTIDASSLSSSLTLYLTPGYWGYSGSARAATISSAGQVTVNFGSSIENAVGTRQGDAITGNELANRLEGGGGADILIGGAGDDTLVGGEGNDAITGGAGTDVASFTGARAGYTIAYTASSGTFTVTDTTAGRDGVDQVREVEQLRFADRTLSTATLTVETSQRGDLLLALGVYRGLNGTAPSAAEYAQAVSSLAGGSPSSYALGQGAGFASQAGDTFTSSVMSNFGITASALAGASPTASYDALKGALTQIFTLYAPARGQVVLNMTTLLAGLEGDAVFGGVARTWNARVSSDLNAVSGSALVAAEDGLLALVGVPEA